MIRMKICTEIFKIVLQGAKIKYIFGDAFAYLFFFEKIVFFCLIISILGIKISFL